MQIKNLTGKELRQARVLAPDEILGKGTLVLGAITKETLAGVAVLMKCDLDWVITWLFVDPDYRKQGYGSALIQEAVSEARNAGAALLSMDLEGDSEAGRVMAFMLTKHFFCLHFEQMASIQITREQLEKSVIFTDPRYAIDNKKRSFKVASLKDVKSTELFAFQEGCERHGNYLVSRADYRGADGKVSKALVVGEKIAGVVLFERTGVKDYELQLSYVEKKHQTEFISLIRAAAVSLLEVDGWEKLDFVCMNSSVLQLAEHIFPEKEIVWNCIITGERWL